MQYGLGGRRQYDFMVPDHLGMDEMRMMTTEMQNIQVDTDALWPNTTKDTSVTESSSGHGAVATKECTQWGVVEELSQRVLEGAGGIWASCW